MLKLIKKCTKPINKIAAATVLASAILLPTVSEAYVVVQGGPYYGPHRYYYNGHYYSHRYWYGGRYYYNRYWYNNHYYYHRHYNGHRWVYY